MPNINRFYPFLLFVLLVSCRISSSKTEQEYREPQSDGIEQAMWQEFRMTRDPALNRVPRERLIAARDYMNQLSTGGVGAARGEGISALSWQERGPSNVGGRTRAIVIDKRDATGNTVFSGSVSGGLFKTTNFNSFPPVWAPVNDFLPNLAISAMIQDTAHPDTLFAATGEGWGNYDAVKGAGIFKSTDGGNTWNVLPSTTGFEYVQDLLIDNNGFLFASLRNQVGSFRGVLRSTDRGSTWVQVLGLPLPGFNTGRAADLELAANGDIYASLGILSRSQVLKSSFAVHGVNTGGLGTWTDITPSTPNITQRSEIILAPSDAQRVYLLMQDSATSQVLNVYRSNNGGSNWITLPAPAALNNGANSQTWYNLIGAVDPGNADILVVGGLHIAKSTDGGSNWTSITTSGTVHVDHHVLIYDGSTRLVNGNDGGVYHTTTINLASPVFFNKNNGFNVTQYYGGDLHPTSTNYFLAGSQDNGTQKFTSAGINATANATGGDGGVCHIDQTNGQLQITSNTANNYYRSLDGGNSFSSLSSINNNRGQFINPTDLSDAQKILYAGDDPGKYFCVLNLTGTVSSVVATVVPMGNQEVTAVKVDPNASSTIWVGASFGAPASLPTVFKLTNANSASPTVVVNTTIASAVDAAISSIDVDPANSNNILVTISSYGVPSVFISTNGGNSFVNIEGNLPDMPIRWGLFAPANAQLNGSTGGNGGILLGTELGVWTTSVINGSSTAWMPNNSGLANVRTDMLKYRSSDNTVVAATHGRGLYTTVLPTTVTGINPPANTRNFIKYIHASHQNLLIVAGTLNTRNMTVQLYNSAGQKVHEAKSDYQDVTINLQNLGRGVYVLRCTGNNRESFISQFVVGD